MNIKPILIVAGEPYSIFSEIFFKALKGKKYRRPIVLIASQDLFVAQMKSLNFTFKINTVDSSKLNLEGLKKNYINLINVNFKSKRSFNKITNKSNSYIEKSFHIALKLLKTKKFSGLINGPISKKNFLGEKFLGITEYLASKTIKNDNIAMLIYHKNLSVSPLTTHLPLMDVNKKITKKKIINNVKLISDFYKKKLNISARIAITGLNPHCESNYKSSEEKRFIIPAIKYLIKKKYKVSGPFAADTIFMSINKSKYDIILGMYHDQVLTPAKALFGFNPINITLGLPFIRISPDHGPNEKMQGKNNSNPQSLIEALKFLDK